MAANTSQTVASRLGYGLGQVVRLVWCSQNRTLRFAKRLAFIAFTVYSWVWLSHAVMAVLTTVLILIAVVLGAFSSRREGASPEVSAVGWQNGPDGWGYYDMYGNCHTFGDDDE
ncbi:hypothetical protein KFQ04_01655 [Pseudomonas synxantha]|nr:hypothetical protein KFQ04_01655 [Pseudomonas synxantha]